MLNPSIVELLDGVAAALRNEVVEELPPGPAQDQVRDAVAVIRRVARAIPNLTPYLITDIVDVAATIEALGGGHSAAVDALPPSGDGLDLESLTTQALQLRGQLAAIAERDDLDPEAEERLQLALARLTEREASLRLSPWER
jgi:hypothetical protein